MTVEKCLGKQWMGEAEGKKMARENDEIEKDIELEKEK